MKSTEAAPAKSSGRKKKPAITTPPPTTTTPTTTRRPGRPKMAADATHWGGANATFPMRMPDKMIEALKQEATSVGVTPPTIVRVAIEAFLAMPAVERAAKIKDVNDRQQSFASIRIIKRATVKITGTEPRLEDTDHPDRAHRKGRDKGRYVLICDVHTTAQHDGNREHALGVLSAPWKWCAGCKALMLADPGPGAAS